MNLRNAFNRGDRVIEETSRELVTKQSEKDSTDINLITERFLRTGTLGTPGKMRNPMFGDFSSIDFQQMRNQIADAEMAFSSLPGRLRSRFKNDPANLLRFVENEANREEAIKLGLIEAPVEGEKPEAKPAGTPATSSSPPAPESAPKPDPEANPAFKRP